MVTPRLANEQYVEGTGIIDISERKFGRWTVVSFSHKVEKNKYWICQCDCGRRKTINYSNLKSGASSSCGCLHKERARAASVTHGLSKHPAYKSWQHAKHRCFNKDDQHWDRYGGRGITMCPEWANSFESFWKDMGGTYKDGLTLERINFNGHYEPGNCKWATMSEQLRNTERSIFIETPWGLMNIADAADKLGISRVTMQNRFHSGMRGSDLLFQGRHHKSRRNVVSSTTLADLGLDD